MGNSEIRDLPGHPGREHCEGCLKEAERDALFGTDLGPSGRPEDRCCCYDGRSESVRLAQAAAVAAREVRGVPGGSHRPSASASP